MRPKGHHAQEVTT